MVYTRKIAAVLLFWIAAVLAGGVPPSAQAQTASSAERERQIRQLLKERDRQIKDILGTQNAFTQAQREELMTLINGLIDFRTMGRTALGPHWDDLSYSQQEEFIKVFSQVVKEQSLSDLAPYRAPVSYEEIRVSGDSAYVRTVATQQGERIPVEYDLVYRSGEKENSGEWRAKDIIVDEVSTVGGYKRSFRSIIRRHGYQALMKSLRNRLKKTQAGG